MTALERRCRWLLRAYPARYRADRGDEMLATLLEASPDDARWPSLRDTRALIMGGLKVRACGHRRLDTAASLRLALMLSVVLALLWYFSGQLGFDVWVEALRPRAPGVNVNLGYYWYRIATDVLGLAVGAAAWFASRRAVVITLACAATSLAAAVTWEYPGRWGTDIQPAGLLVLLLILAYSRQHLPRSWIWLTGAICLPNMLEAITSLDLRSLLPFYIADVSPVFLWILLGAVVVWAVVDPRLAIAMAIWIAASYLPYVQDEGLQASPYVIWSLQWQVPTAAAAVIGAAAIWRLRRQAVL